MNRAAVPVAFAACVLIWGGSWLAIQATVAEADPIGVAALRCAAATVLALSIAAAARVPLPTLAQAKGLLLAGFVLIGANYAVVYWSAPQLPSGVAALLYATAPLQAVLLAPLLGQGRPRVRDTVGPALAVFGIAVAFSGSGAAAALPFLALLGIGLGATTSAAGTLLASRHRDAHPLWSILFTNAAGALLLLPTSALLEDGPVLPRSAEAWAGFAYMLVAGSLVAFLLYFWLLRHLSAARASFTTVVTPFVSYALAVLVAHEALSLRFALGALVVAGAVLMSRRKRSASNAPATPTGPVTPAIARPD